MKMTKDGRLRIGTRVAVKGPHFSYDCVAVIKEALYDDGWLYRVEVISGESPELAREKSGEIWLCDFEVKPLKS